MIGGQQSGVVNLRFSIADADDAIDIVTSVSDELKGETGVTGDISFDKLRGEQVLGLVTGVEGVWISTLADGSPSVGMASARSYREVNVSHSDL